MKKSIIFILTLILTCLAISAQAQSRKVSGRVTDMNGEPLVGVGIQEEGTKNGAISDLDGNYSIEVASNRSVLEFSYLGFESQSVMVGANGIIDITMKEATSELDELVVVAYGT